MQLGEGPINSICMYVLDLKNKSWELQAVHLHDDVVKKIEICEMAI